MDTYYYQVRDQVIYQAAELGGAGLITGLALDVETLPGQTMNNFTLRMQPTTLSSYSSYASQHTGWTTVYQSNQTISSTGWDDVQLHHAVQVRRREQPDGGFQLQQLVVHRHLRLLLRDLHHPDPALYYSTDNGYGNPCTWSGSSPSPYTNSYIPNIRLSVSPPVSIAPPRQP